MLTKRELELFCGVLKQPCTSYVIPYDFEYFSVKQELNIRPTDSFLKRFLGKFHFGLCIFYTTFNLIRVIQLMITFISSNTVENSVKLEDLLLGNFFLLTRATHLLLPLTFVNSNDALSQLTNRQRGLNSIMGVLTNYLSFL